MRDTLTDPQPAEDEPSCPSCGVAYTDHLGLIGTCKALQEANEQIAHLQLVVDVLTGKAGPPPMAVGDHESTSAIVKMRSAMVSMVVRELGRSCIEVGGENNLSVMLTPEAADHEYAGWQYEVHVTRPGKLSPTKQRDQARGELARLQAALTTPEGYRAQVAEAVADELERLRANETAREGVLRRREDALRKAERERDEARAEAARLRAQVAELLANGVSIHKAAARERAAVVDWLRSSAAAANYASAIGGDEFSTAADAIERGEHIPDEVTP